MQAPTGESGRHSFPKIGQSEGSGEPEHDRAADAVLGEQVARGASHRGGVDPEPAARVHVIPLRPELEVAARDPCDAAPVPGHQSKTFQSFSRAGPLPSRETQRG